MDTFEVAAPRLFVLAYRVAFRLIGDDEDASDLAQETLARAWVRWSRVGGYAEAWATRTVTNLVMDRFRRSKGRYGATLAERSTVTGGDLSAMRLDLVRALQSLPTRQREAVVLRYLADVDESVARVGWPGASQPPAPTDPGVTVSRHRAPLISPLVSSCEPNASGRTARAVDRSVRSTTGGTVYGFVAAGTSSQPSVSGRS